MKSLKKVIGNKTKANRFFNRAANLWVSAINRGEDDEQFQSEMKEIEILQEKGVKAVNAEFPGVKVSWPGLYPCFEYKGRHYTNLDTLWQWGETDAAK